MKYKIAENIINLSVADGLQAWAEIESRYRPFAVFTADEAQLEVTVSSGPMTPYNAEPIYEPDYAGIGVLTSRTLRLADGRLLLEFRHIDLPEPRLQMVMPTDFRRADIVMRQADDGNDIYFLTHALMLAYMLATCGNGTLLMHASAVVHGGRAYLFQGRSGTGKSTHALMWLRHIEGTRLLNDDHPIVRFDADGRLMAYGSPWSGKTHCYRNDSAPVGGFVRIVRSEHNRLHRLAPLQAYASLTASVFFLPFLSDRLRDIRHRTIERILSAAPCYEMHCRPDAEAAKVCWIQLSPCES